MRHAAEFRFEKEGEVHTPDYNLHHGGLSHSCLKLARSGAVCSIKESVAGQGLLDAGFEDRDEAMDDADVKDDGV